MKSYLKIFFVFSIMSFSFMGSNFTSLLYKEYNEYGLKGKVKIILETDYSADDFFGEVSKGLKTCERKYEFNIDSNLIKKSDYIFGATGEYRNSPIVHTHIYNYVDGKINSISFYNNFIKPGEFQYKTIFNWNGKKQIARTYKSNGESNGSYTVKLYDEKDNLIKHSFNYDNPKGMYQNSYYHYTYDNQNILVKEKHFWKDHSSGLAKKALRFISLVKTFRIE